jgi:hypothetical protein
MRRSDRDPTLFLLGRLVDLIEGNKIRHPLQTAQLRDRGRQGRLAMVNVTDRPYVYVRLRPLKFFLRHLPALLLAGTFAPTRQKALIIVTRRPEQRSKPHADNIWLMDVRYQR